MQPLLYVSTLGIFGRDLHSTPESVAPFGGRVENAVPLMGYAQSKVCSILLFRSFVINVRAPQGVSEHLVEVAHSRWGLPALVIRPPMIGPDSRSG